ncbi:YcxB family protein [Campylobacter showae]|uniref:YcxB family protein n=1 Tax=Campylobacter showae TaxID=204 RepID=UPI0028D8AD8B|nr:YcxB family protein [Campylobacter showae]
MSNLKADFELKPNAEYKKTAREVAKIVYKGDKFMRYISLCDFAAIVIGMIFITLLCVKFYINDLDCLLEDYGYESAAILPYLAWIGAFLTVLYATGLRPWLLIRALINKANYGEFGQKSVILEDEFFMQKSKFGEGRYFYNIISNARYVGNFLVVIIANSMFYAVPREAFGDGGAEFLSEIKKRAGLDA